MDPEIEGLNHSLAFWLSTFLICLAAFVATALISAQVFEHVPRSEDEAAYLFQAKVFAQNRLTVPTPAMASLFWSPFVVDYQGQRFGKYPPGWPLLLSLGVRVGAPWLINALLGSLTLALTAWLGRRIYSPQAGLWAAGLGLLAPGFLVLSSSLLSHTASLFWTTLALAALFKLTDTSQTSGRGYSFRHAALTGLALGAAFATRPFAAAGVGLAVGLFLLFLSLRGEIGWPVWFWLILGGLVTGGLLPLFWWAVTGDPGFNAYVLVWPYDRIGFGPDIGPYGYGLAIVIFNTYLKLSALATSLFGWPGWTNLLFVPVPFLLRRAGRWGWLLLGTLGGLVFIHLFYWAFGGVDGGFPRYYYDSLPALLLLTAWGIQLAGKGLNRWQFTLPQFSPKKLSLGYLPPVLVILFTVYNLGWSLPAHLAAQKGKYGITAAPLQAVNRANIKQPALIIVKEVESWRDFAAPFAANNPTLDGRIVFAIDGGPQQNPLLRALFPGRTCWELIGDRLKPCSPLQ